MKCNILLVKEIKGLYFGTRYPSRAQLTAVVQLLVHKYPFLKDHKSIGSGYVSSSIMFTVQSLMKSLSKLNRVVKIYFV